jgi:hypothetical protein
LRPVGKLSMLSESLWWSIGKSDTEIGKSATKAIVMSGKFFYQKRCRRGGVGRRDLKCCGPENFFGSTWVFAGPPDQKSWLRLCCRPNIRVAPSLSFIVIFYRSTIVYITWRGTEGRSEKETCQLRKTRFKTEPKMQDFKCKALIVFSQCLYVLI